VKFHRRKVFSEMELGAYLGSDTNPTTLQKRRMSKDSKYDLLVLETCLVENDDSARILDSGATNYVSSSYQGFSS
ncbi:hypothetical protein, partial [Klebsiella pneumoniae]|uniref:hypothetical protein n=1 Tax=Klebsiella pneumoniae TaxID=573 RepID=UPI003013AECF